MTMPGKSDVTLVRGLAARVAEIAALPVQEEKRTLWRKLNARKPARPMVMIDEVCWNEMDLDGELALQCADDECRGYEQALRRTLYQMSPWVDQERGAEEIGGDYVYSRKPNPALVAPDAFDPDAVRADLTRTRDLCAQHGCPLELILKDISTVRYEPGRLFEWARIAMRRWRG